ncbi:MULTISPECIES: lmo0937 family membrane protein [Shouchella]|uniref:Lmo0937 family membrane protein n=2 Tax=Shouchella TaxID=2893057 RepID=A0ABY7W6I4_9BACI|nr:MULTISPECIES: lmo0937 family membrane protein [Shouchella]MED4128543.1 lmo0937 family membrane protein [Shouchella miscanthi]WDF02340.1 lmo0937 family membrane protein [Shouchella hunanensis]
MLWTILGIILAVWLVGLVLDVAGGFINLLLIVALIVLIIQLVKGRK